MKKAILGLALLCVAAPVQAGFVSVDVMINVGNMPQPISVPGFSRQVTIGDDGNVAVGLNEKFLKHFPGELIFQVVTDDDPVMSITKTVENDTDIIWTAYEIKVAGAGVSFMGTPTSDVFQNAALVDSTTLLFSEPLTVAPGESVTFNFDLLVETIGTFEFTLTQTPIPEPASMLLLGLGGLLLRRRVR